MSKKIYDINKSNVDEVVSLHREAYVTDHFSILMSNRYLKLYYLSLTNNKFHDLSFLLQDNGTSKGFVICGENLNNNVKLFVKQHWLYIISVILMHPKFLVPKIKALFTRFSKSNWKSKASVRLLSIAVNKNSHNQGVGKLLLKNLEEKLKKHNITIYGLSVKKTNVNAIKFYEKNNFCLEHDDGKSLYYYKVL